MSNKVKLLAAALALAVPAAGVAQYTSVGVDFLKAVKERDGGKLIQSLRANKTQVLNYRDDQGTGALHLLAARRDVEWFAFLLSEGADPNVQTRSGDTALIVASRGGWMDGVNMLLRVRGRVDLANRLGETPLIVAVQQRQPAVVKRLLEAGANADKSDNASGRSARDYAKMDRRSVEMLRLIETVKPAGVRTIAGPKL